MAQLDTLDIIVLAVLLVGSIAYFTKGTLWAKPKDPYAGSYASANGTSKASQTRDINEKMNDTGKNCVVFYGSQTGTAEDYASRIAKEGSSRFGLKTMVADLEDYDYTNLDQFPEDKVAVFVLATYGEGEPTDNAVEFYEFFMGEDISFSQGGTAENNPLSNLKYVTFGLGNNTYEHYNAMVRRIDTVFRKLGALRLGEAGEGDDGAGTMEEDFLAWKEPMWAHLQKTMNLEEREAVYEPVFSITESEELDASSSQVYLGEPNRSHLDGKPKAPFNSNNPYIAPIAESRELFTVKDRNCLHMEIDVSGSNLSYQTGDHIAVWPTNAGNEVDRFLSVLGLADKRNTVINIKGLDPTARVPFPTPTTYDAIVRYHLEIGGAVSRQFVDTLAAFAPDEASKAEMKKIGQDKDYFQQRVAQAYLNIAGVLDMVKPGVAWSNVPFSAMIEGINKIQPRYYSISSSSIMQPKKISITAVVSDVAVDIPSTAPGGPAKKHVLRGVTTNYLLALKQKQHGTADPDPHGLQYALSGPRDRYINGSGPIRVPVHVRHSNFKLPSDPSRPVIMIGPGTGVAPFRGFVQERAKLASDGQKVGRTILFFGCRKQSEDFLYKDEWEVCCSSFHFFQFMYLGACADLSLSLTPKPWDPHSPSSPLSRVRSPARRSTFSTGSRSTPRRSTLCSQGRRMSVARPRRSTSAATPRTWPARSPPRWRRSWRRSGESAPRMRRPSSGA